MRRSLVIVESPAKAKTIEKFLGRNFLVKASVGHTRDLPKSQLGVDIDDGFRPRYITIRGKGEILKELREAARKAERVYLAADPDREGEAIAWHLAHALGLDGEGKCRLEFHEITREAVRAALADPRRVDMFRVNAQQARRVLDRLVGYKLSPLLWRKVRPGLSAGRVQSVAVRLVCDREDEINSFVAQEYWTVEAQLETGEGRRFAARLVQVGEEKPSLATEEQAQAVVRELEGARFVVSSVKERERRRNAAPPFITSSLQQEASRKLGFGVRKTMFVAQQLYEGLDIGDGKREGLITYMRTDSVRVAESAAADARAVIERKFGRDYLPEQPRSFASGPMSQGAHEAIRPTAIAREPEEVRQWLTPDQYRLYKLVWDRFVASQMGPAIYLAVTVEVAAGRFTLRANSSTLKFGGFTAVYVEEGEGERGEESVALPPLREGEELRLVQVVPHQHFTEPPPRFTEAMLVRTLEEKGIGRPSTYAPIIDTIRQRGYVVLHDRRFVPTQLGRLVVELLKRYFPEVIDVEFTATMEGKLDMIEGGKLDWVRVVDEFYRPFARTLAHAEQEISGVEVRDEPGGVFCELCGREMVIKHGRYGKFLACPGFPECKNTRPYLEKTGVLCPLCGGEVVERKSRKGRRFYGCSLYPACNFLTWEKPAGRDCPQCGAFLVEKKGSRGGGLRCVRPECDYAERLEPQE